MSQVPAIYHRPDPAPPMAMSERIIAGVIALFCLTPLVLAVGLSPDPSGMGTHHALHLAKCGWLERSGIPCPTCGMTTSFAWFVRGNWLASLYVQPMGFLVAVLSGMVFWVAGYEAVTGHPLHRLLRSIPLRYTVLPLMGLTVLGWGWKMFIYLKGIDGWR